MRNVHEIEDIFKILTFKFFNLHAATLELFKIVIDLTVFRKINQKQSSVSDQKVDYTVLKKWVFANFEELFNDDFNWKIWPILMMFITCSQEKFRKLRWIQECLATACKLSFPVPGWQNFITRWALSVLSAYPVWAEETQSNLPKITFSNFRFSQKMSQT